MKDKLSNPALVAAVDGAQEALLGLIQELNVLVGLMPMIDERDGRLIANWAKGNVEPRVRTIADLLHRRGHGAGTPTTDTAASPR